MKAPGVKQPATSRTFQHQSVLGRVVHWVLIPKALRQSRDSLLAALDDLSDDLAGAANERCKRDEEPSK